jgi:ATP-dependent DNA helicase RecG
MPISEILLSRVERDKILALEENHFCDLKATAVAAGKLTRTIAALSNAEGGEVYVGIAQDRWRRNFWSGLSCRRAPTVTCRRLRVCFPLATVFLTPFFGIYIFA